MGFGITLQKKLYFFENFVIPNVIAVVQPLQFGLTI